MSIFGTGVGQPMMAPFLAQMAEPAQRRSAFLPAFATSAAALRPTHQMPDGVGVMQDDPLPFTLPTVAAETPMLAASGPDPAMAATSAAPPPSPPSLPSSIASEGGGPYDYLTSEQREAAARYLEAGGDPEDVAALLAEAAFQPPSQDQMMRETLGADDYARAMRINAGLEHGPAAPMTEYQRAMLDLRRQEMGMRQAEAQAAAEAAALGPARLSFEEAAAEATEGERRAAGFYERALNVGADLDAMLTADRDGNGAPDFEGLSSNADWQAVNTPFERAKLSAEEQKYITRARSWILAVVRDESGAQIPETEMDNYVRTLFPLPGDDPTTVAEKSRLRQGHVDALRIKAGSLAPYVDERFTGPSSASPRGVDARAQAQNAFGPTVRRGDMRAQLGDDEYDQVRDLAPGSVFRTDDGVTYEVAPNGSFIPRDDFDASAVEPSVTGPEDPPPSAYERGERARGFLGAVAEGAAQTPGWLADRARDGVAQSDGFLRGLIGAGEPAQPGVAPSGAAGPPPKRLSAEDLQRLSGATSIDEMRELVMVQVDGYFYAENPDGTWRMIGGPNPDG